ncbi:MAG: methionine ABC transporter ATP-binding protein [Deferribacteraceae bacterium]|nr:methionine ABC transporter ATP-binding protein [Deferribacteraceae bacterium]
MIKLNTIAKSYNSAPVLSGVTLEIPSNIIYGIIGKSGAGKSTLVRIMSLLESTDSGEIYFDDKRVDNLRGNALLERRRKLGMIFQNFNLFLSRNVYGNIAYPLEISGVDKAEIKGRVEELLELVGLSDKIESPISKLSGGQKQRVAIARALAVRPEILFCDEATSALDPQTTTSILTLIKNIQTQMNLTVVMITHQMEVVREICDFVSVLDEGEIVESGTVKDVFAFPRTKVAREFLGSIKPIDGDDILEIEPSLAHIYRLHFLGESTKKPVISEFIKQSPVNINILSGTIRTVGEVPIGELVVEMEGSAPNIEIAKRWLADRDVKMEALDA